MNISKKDKSKNNIGMIIIFIFIIIIILIVVAIIAILLSNSSTDLSSNSLSNSLNSLSNFISNSISNSISRNTIDTSTNIFIDCVGKWSDCTGECGNAVQTYEYIIEPNDKGYPCYYRKGETKKCVKSECAIDCVGEWSHCILNDKVKNCGKGKRIFNVKIQGNAEYNDKAKRCEANNNDEQDCMGPICNIDCVGSWTGCSRPCGNGVDTFVQTVEQSGAGSHCTPRTNYARKVCNDGICPPGYTDPPGICGEGGNDKICTENLPCCSLMGICSKSDVDCLKTSQVLYNWKADNILCGANANNKQCTESLRCCSKIGICGNSTDHCYNSQVAYNWVPRPLSCGPQHQERKCLNENKPYCGDDGWCRSWQYGTEFISYNIINPLRCGLEFGKNCREENKPYCGDDGICREFTHGSNLSKFNYTNPYNYIPHQKCSSQYELSAQNYINYGNCLNYDYPYCSSTGWCTNISDENDRHTFNWNG
jgi:hypothetical protein